MRIVSKSHGFNLVEAAIVLGVVGLVIGGIWTAASAVRANLNMTETLKGFALLKANMDKVQTFGAAYNTISNDCPAGWTYPGSCSSCCMHPSDKNIQFGAARGSSPYLLIYTGGPLTPTNCAALASRVSGSYGANGPLDQIEIVTRDNTFYIGRSGLPIDYTTANDLCFTDGNSSTEVRFSFSN